LIRAVQAATRKLAGSGKFDDLLREVLRICSAAVGAQNGTIYLHDAATGRLTFRHVIPEKVIDQLPAVDIPDDFGVAGQAFRSRKSVIRDYPEKPRAEWNEIELATGVQVRSIIATPLSMEDEQPIGVVQLINKDGGTFNEMDAAVLDTVSAVATMAYLNAQLVDESAKASTLLGMGRVSHDIGNLAASLYATLSFGDMAMGGLKNHLMKSKPDRTVRMYVDSLEPMFRELKDSVDRIVGYSRLISDLSAGRPLQPELTLAPMGESIHNAASYFEAQGRAEHIALRYEIDFEAPATFHDDVFVVRIVQNLVGNAIKAVRETLPDDLAPAGDYETEEYYGQVDVRYRFASNQHIIEIRDTGPGIAPDTISRILSGTARSQWEKAGGSGWGTRIVLELATALGGEVEIDSEIGIGSTFRVRFPHRPSLG